MTDTKPYRHRFPMTTIQHAVGLYHRFLLSHRDVQEFRHQRGIGVSHQTLRDWWIKFGPLFAEHLRQREPRRGSRWYLDEVCMTVDGVRHWLWRAVDEHGFVLDILLQRHRDTEAAIREIPSLADVDHQSVVSRARCNNSIEQEHRSTRRQERFSAAVGLLGNWLGYHKVETETLVQALVIAVPGVTTFAWAVGGGRHAD